MKLLLVLAGIIIFDRAIPMGAFRFSADALKVSEGDYMRRYGVVSFPRTFFALCILLVTALGYFVAMTSDVQGLIAVAFATLFAISAGIDAWRAARQ